MNAFFFPKMLCDRVLSDQGYITSIIFIFHVFTMTAKTRPIQLFYKSVTLPADDYLELVSMCALGYILSHFFLCCHNFDSMSVL